MDLGSEKFGGEKWTWDQKHFQQGYPESGCDPLSEGTSLIYFSYFSKTCKTNQPCCLPAKNSLLPPTKQAFLDIPTSWGREEDLGSEKFGGEKWTWDQKNLGERSGPGIRKIWGREVDLGSENISTMLP